MDAITQKAVRYLVPNAKMASRMFSRAAAPTARDYALFQTLKSELPHLCRSNLVRSFGTGSMLTTSVTDISFASLNSGSWDKFENKKIDSRQILDFQGFQTRSFSVVKREEDDDQALSKPKKVHNADVATPWQVGFQDPATPVMSGIIDLHHDIMGISVFIMMFVTWMLGRAVILFKDNPYPQRFTHGTFIEVAWTVTPSLILTAMAIPSFSLLYSTDELNDPEVTLKVVGHQWYWTYEYGDYATDDENSIVFDSYMVAEDDLEMGQLRLLEVDNRVVLPAYTPVRCIITSSDVMHCWAIPSFAIKCDAIPGRLNQASLFIEREGLFYGQCSELCGANHGFMPIVVESVTMEEYSTWLTNMIADL